jgi:acetyl-CoA synthetase
MWVSAENPLMDTVLDAYDFQDREWDSLKELREDFEWDMPEEFNAADWVCDRWADEKHRVALYSDTPDGDERTYTFWHLQNLSNQLANFLEDQGVQPGDRIGVSGSQTVETVISHLAGFKLGATLVPLSPLFGPQGLKIRVDDADVTTCIFGEANSDALYQVVDELATVPSVLTFGDAAYEDGRDLWNAIDGYSREYTNAVTQPDDDAFIYYTSGTTGQPKGVRHGHRIVLGLLVYYNLVACNLQFQDDDLVWTPAEWSWSGTFIPYVLTSFFYGRPVLAYDRDQFDSTAAMELIEKYDISVCHFPPTALRMMRDAFEDDHDLSSVRVISVGGESLGVDIRGWITKAFGDVVAHGTYGETEVMGQISECNALFEPKPDSMGRALPGHETRILDEETLEPVEPGEVGVIATRYEGDPICFKSYLNRPGATEKKVQDGWLLADDLGREDEDGYYYFVSRKDDVIISSGYTISPQEIEETINTLPYVIESAVIGIPDDTRGEIPMAFVKLTDNKSATNETKEVIQNHVKEDLAKYEYPRVVEFMESFPKTSTGKIQRVELRAQEPRI